jgi:hypothetical protein
MTQAQIMSDVHLDFPGACGFPPLARAMQNSFSLREIHAGPGPRGRGDAHCISAYRYRSCGGQSRAGRILQCAACHTKHSSAPVEQEACMASTRVRRIAARPDPAHWGDDELLTFAEAAARLWPDGPLTASSLRDEEYG